MCGNTYDPTDGGVIKIHGAILAKESPLQNSSGKF